MYLIPRVGNVSPMFVYGPGESQESLRERIYI